MAEGLADHQVVYQDGKAVDYVITDVNPAFEQITGLPRMDSVGRKASELYGTGSPPYLDIYARWPPAAALSNSRRTSLPWNALLHLRVLPGERQVCHRVPGYYRPKDGRGALRESEIRYRTVAENTYDWEYWVDPEGRMVYCSPSCERITGHSAEEFLADPTLRARLIHPTTGSSL